MSMTARYLKLLSYMQQNYILTTPEEETKLNTINENFKVFDDITKYLALITNRFEMNRHEMNLKYEEIRMELNPINKIPEELKSLYAEIHIDVNLKMEEIYSILYKEFYSTLSKFEHFVLSLLDGINTSMDNYIENSHSCKASSFIDLFISLDVKLHIFISILEENTNAIIVSQKQILNRLGYLINVKHKLAVNSDKAIRAKFNSEKMALISTISSIKKLNIYRPFEIPAEIMFSGDNVLMYSKCLINELIDSYSRS